MPVELFYLLLAITTLVAILFWRVRRWVRQSVQNEIGENLSNQADLAMGWQQKQQALSRWLKEPVRTPKETRDEDSEPVTVAKDSLADDEGIQRHRFPLTAAMIGGGNPGHSEPDDL